tara:strand:- start:2630 stop:3508 length:879 start_codon:yes stop_codon:yes gene_type:complete
MAKKKIRENKIDTLKKRHLPFLSKAREYELTKRWQTEKDEKALHELILAYGLLTSSIAHKYRNYGMPIEDLIQEGNIGLLQAADRFDTTKDVRFSTYANWWVRAAMQDYILRNWSVVRIGTTAAQKSLFFNFRRLKAKIASTTTGYLCPTKRLKIAKELGVTPNDVELMEGRLFRADQSLNSIISESSDTEWQNILPDNRTQTDDLVLEEQDSFKRRAWLKKSLSYLSERERRIIDDRRLKENSRTLEEIGAELGISKERVRQIEQKALNKLKELVLKHANIGLGERVFGDI